MNKLSKLLLGTLVTVVSPSFAQTTSKSTTKATHPKLIIGVVIDQMRYDYLFRYAKNYGNGGFKRLMREGFNCEATYLNYLPSVTGCGHAGIYSGSVPALHGIAGNDWYDRKTGKMMYCTQDDSAKIVGGVGKSGKMSPKNLLCTTITDELRLATNFRSKVIGISLKDRGSILPAGHLANEAYWMDDSAANFVTSTYYTKTLPLWAVRFNEKNLARQYLNKDWHMALPAHKYVQSTADDNLYEGKYKTDASAAFPHYTSRFIKNADIKRVPFGNDIALDFAMAAIVGEQLGKSPAATDFLALSLSSTDYVGHQFGINAIEIEDMYYRLDQSMANFLTFLDAQLGAGNYTLFLTADHGAAHNPKFLQDQNIPAGLMYPNLVKKKINDLATVKFGHAIVAEIGDNMIWLNDSAPKQEASALVCETLAAQNEIQFVIPFADLQNTVLPEKLKTMATNGYNKERSGDILYILKPGYIDGYAAGVVTGTTHGTWNPYDTHIPMLWYGNGIRTGHTFTPYKMCDIASTIAALLHIQPPNANIGEVMTEVLR
jgi:predicted AlkP superfamily pyrophosphatase or phosphodiesterase